jgi:hypothetical protein
MAAPREYSGKGFILGGVTDELPDWLGSYDEGVQGAQQQQQNQLNLRETKQRMGENAAAEARRAQEWNWKTQDRMREEAAWGDTAGALDPTKLPQGPGLGPMAPQVLPPAIAPSAGLAEEAPVSNQPEPLSRQAFIDMLPEWAGYESQAGLPPGFLERTAALESSNGTNFRKGSQYIGVFQIGNDVAKDFGVTPEQLKDPRVNAQVAAKLAARNARQLREGLGREPQPWELYLAHQQGAGGALALLRSPSTNVVEALTAAYGGDRSRAMEVVTANGGNPQMTAGQFAQVWANKFAGPFKEAAPAAGIDPADPYPEQPRYGRMGYTGQEFGAPVVEKRTSLPAGLMDVAPDAAPAATPAPAPGPAPAPAPGLAETAPNLAPVGAPTGEIMPRVSREEYAGINDGTGTITQQIMRTPAGQQAALPDSGLYIAEPAKIKTELFQLQQARRQLETQYAEAVRFRDRASMADARSKAVQIDAGIVLLNNMKSIAAFQAGDVNQISQALSRLTGGQTRIQEVQPAGTFNIYQNGKLAYQNVPKEALIASLRSQFDAQYQAMVAAQTERQDEVEMEVLKGQITANTEVKKRQADLVRDAYLERLKQQKPDLFTQVSEDGSVTIVDRNTQQIRRFIFEPVLGIDGEAVVGPDGNPKVRMREIGAQTSVPVQ